MSPLGLLMTSHHKTLDNCLFSFYTFHRCLTSDILHQIVVLGDKAMVHSTISRKTIVQQVHDALVDLLRNEEFRAGSSIPSEQELAERFEVSRATVREALKGLVQAGFLDCRHGKGYFVLSQDAMIHKPITHLQSVTELMGEFGYDVENRVLHVSEETPSPHVRRELLLDEGQTVIRLERVRSSRGEPLIYSIDIFPRAFVSGPWQEQDWTGSLFSLFAEHSQIHVSTSRATMSAATLLPELCATIGVPASTAWFCMEQVNLTKVGKPVLFSQDYHRGESFTFYVTRRRL
jgi:GntR family transcriptional regulator